MVKIILFLTTFLLFNVNGAIARSTNEACDRDRGLVASYPNDSSNRGNLSLDSASEAKVSTDILERQIETNLNNEKSQISIASIAIPSLWWARKQFDPFGGRLIDDWLTYPQIKQIDLTVNWQLWTLLDYLGRYRFINQLGTVARSYGYSLRIFNQQQQCLAHYKYNDKTNPPKWEITIEGLGQDSLQIEPLEE